MADPEELTRLGITPAKVHALLAETLWQSSAPKPIRVVRLDRVPRDEAVWEVYYPHPTAGTARVVYKMIDTPGIGWKLNASSLLRSTCYWKDLGKGPELYRQLARKHGIDGLREQDGDYLSLQQLEARSASLPVRP
jgi:hypothetical protein